MKIDSPEAAKCVLMSVKVLQALKESNPDAHKDELRRMIYGRKPTKAYIEKFREMYPKWTTAGEFDD